MSLRTSSLLVLLVVMGGFLSSISPIFAFTPMKHPTAIRSYHHPYPHSTVGPYLHILKASSRDDDDDDDDDDDELDLPEEEAEDWRAFRAKLVMSESSSSSFSSTTTASMEPNATEETQQEQQQQQEGDLDGIGTLFSSSSSTTTTTTTSNTIGGLTPLDPSQWAYDSGKVIEQGAVILGGVEQDFGFGLRQQYFHKAAILVLDHEESTFTKGIILNRPTDVMLDDDINPGVKWRVWFGGDVQGLDATNPDIVCLHSLKKKEVTKASVPVMKDIQWTTFDNAKRLVNVGHAKASDFWVFCGYAGWGPGQLMGELDRKSWYMVATDSQTLLKELARQGAAADPRDAGLDTWTLLMNMIGRKETAEEYSGDFDDLMLKEWALKNLLSTEAGGGAGEKKRAPKGAPSTQDLFKTDPVDQLLSRVSAASRGQDIGVGSLVRASSADRSPFLLNDQEMHKSLVLVIADDDNVSVGVVLNRPSSKGLDINVKQKDSSKIITLPIRYGGPYAVRGSEGLLWLHCNSVLRAAKIGSPVGRDEDGIWKCTAEDVTLAVRRGLASADQFIVVSGVSVWTKGERGISRGVQGEVVEGNFEVVPQSKTQDVWDLVAKQEVLTAANLMSSVTAANAAWAAGGVAKANGKKKASDKVIPISGLGEGFDEEDDTVVFKSDVKVSKLSDDALRSWLAAYLLGAPLLGA